jgi:pseudouridine-5'-phosphate glycosidase
LGYGVDEFPAFYSRESGCFRIHPVSSPGGVAAIYKENVSAGLSSAVLVANPVPQENEIPTQEIESIIESACKTAADQNIIGKELTPFLLKEIMEKTGGRSLDTNKALALNNIHLGIQIVKELA